jgi:hypothetical protein
MLTVCERIALNQGLTHMDIASILSYGAIGLGFLLAYLAYQLLASGMASERQVYTYMAFCLSLLIIGGVIQYFDNKRLREGLRTIDTFLAPTAQPLAEVQGQITGLACGGGAHGVAMNGGAEAGNKIAGALAKIASARALAEQLAPVSK